MIRLHDFASATVGKDGCMYKAGLRSSAVNTVDGLGLGVDGADWVGSTANYDFDPVTGATKNTGIDVDAKPLRFSIPADLQKKLSGNAYIQCKVRLSEIVDSVLTSSAGVFFRLDGSFILFLNYLASGGFNSRVTDMDGNRVLGNAVELRLNTGLTENVAHTGRMGHITAATETDADGFVTLGMSLTPDKVTCFINGDPIFRNWRGFNTTYGIPSGVTYFELQYNLILPSRDLLIYDRPLPDINNGVTRIFMCGHSFLGNREDLVFSDQTGEPAAKGPDNVGAVETLISTLHKKLGFDFNLRMIATGGQNMSVWWTELIKEGATKAYDKGTGNYTDAVQRFLPHFCIIFGPFYNGGFTGGTAGFTSRKDAIYQINTRLTALGIIPVYVLEQNGDAANVTPADFTAAHAEVTTELQRWRDAGNDVGIVDGWTTMGGSTVDRTYVEGPDLNSIHPNDKAKSLYGTLCAAELNRLYANPPAYSMLSSLEAAPVTIAAP